MKTKYISQKIKQVKLDLRRQIIETNDGNVEVVINGDLKILAIVMPDKIKPETMKSLKCALNKAIAKAQKNTLTLMRDITQ